MQLKRDLVIACPDIYQVQLGSDAEFIVLASDGLWDYMSRSKLHKWSFSYIVSQEKRNQLHLLPNISAQKQFLL